MRGALVRLYWRELLSFLLFLLPIVTLLPLGLLWLYQSGYEFAWLGFLLLCGLAAAPFLWRLRREAEPLTGVETQADPLWGQAEAEAWASVKALAEATPPLSFGSMDEVLALLKRVFETVSRTLHTDADQPLMRFTVPEALRALELASIDLRRTLLETVPLSHAVRVSDLMWLLGLRRHAGTLQRAYDVYRVLRLALGPVAAVEQESRGAIARLFAVHGVRRIQTGMTRQIVIEAGRAAIDLYGGRHKVSREEAARLVALDRQALPDQAAVLPVRILLAGQVNAGKSSLLNALAQAVLAPVDCVPTPGGFQEFRIARGGAVDVVLVDSPGLDGAGRLDTLVEQALRSDLILWVAAAVRPARALDVAALDRLREAFAARPGHRAPPVVLAVSQMDQLRPARDWAPPYDIRTPASPKAASIAAALETVAGALGVGLGDSVPMAVPQGGEPYNMDLLWARITECLPEAQQTRLNRLLTERQGSWDWRRVLSQAKQGGRMLVRHAVAGSKGPGG
jgi:predicted GTPase